jgi:hypothetical protein
MKTCKFEQDGVKCPRKHSARGWCATHYNQQYLFGETWPIGSPGLPRGKTLDTLDEPKTCHCGKPARSKGLCGTHYQSEYYQQGKAERRKTNNKTFVGNKGAHLRIKAQLGKAANYQCNNPDCHKEALDWSLNHDAQEIFTGVGLAGFSRAFSLDIYSYEPLCRTCHMEKDGTLGANFRGSAQ